MKPFAHILFGSMLLAASSAVAAKTTTWTGTGDWFATPANWSHGLPEAGDTVVVASGALALTSSPPALATFTQNSGTLTFTGWETALNATAVALNGGTVTHPLQSATNSVDGVWVPDNRVRIVCGTFTLNTNIDLSARGFRAGNGFNLPGDGPGGGRDGGGGKGGGGYGGVGGGATTGGVAYGDPEQPQLWPGSGGGYRDQHAGGHGGGLFVLEASGHVALNGSIRADGGNAVNIYGGGGGSGGGVAIRCATLSASGAAITVNGGDGGTFLSGSGGGGRIAITVTDAAAQDALPVPQLLLRARFGSQAYALNYGDYGTFWLNHARLLPAPHSATYGYFHGPVVPDQADEPFALELQVGAGGDVTLASHGHAFISGGVPSVRQVVLETRTLGTDGLLAYAFENADLMAPVQRALAEGDGLELAYPWGVLRFRYAVAASDRFNVTVEIANTGERTLANLDLRLLEILFPDTPTRSDILISNLDQPASTRAAWGVGTHGGVVYACVETPGLLQFGFEKAADSALTRFPLVAKGGIRSFATGDVEMFPHGLPRILPGETATFGLSLRFTPPDVPEAEALASLYAAFRAHHPPVVDWPDRRPIGMIFFDSRGPISASNPRGWFNDPSLDVFSEAGLADLKRRFLQSASNSVSVLKGTGSQGAIVWNVEGEEFPHAISYIGDPRLQAILAPELNGFIDDYFRIFRDAGLRTGVTLRPTQPYPLENGTWTHGTGSHGPDRNPLGDSFDDVWPEGLPWQRFFPIIERLSRKITFARERWGATIFYVDTNGIHPPMGPEQTHTWMLLDPWVFRALRARHPDVLIIPEIARGPAYFGVAAPYDQLDFTKRTTTPERIRRLYPEAFVANHFVNTPRDLLARGQPWFDALVSAVSRGDVLMHRGWFADGHNADLRAIYGDAARLAPFNVFIGTEGLILNGEALPDAAALTAALRQRFGPEPPPLAERRVFVGMAAERSIVSDLNPVLDAIIAGGGVIAWSQVVPPPPAFDPDGGAFPGGAVTVTCSAPGATIRYTLDGSEPDAASPAIAHGGTVLVPLPGTLKAQAWVTGMEPSQVKTAAYSEDLPRAALPYQQHWEHCEAGQSVTSLEGWSSASGQEAVVTAVEYSYGYPRPTLFPLAPGHARVLRVDQGSISHRFGPSGTRTNVLVDQMVQFNLAGDDEARACIGADATIQAACYANNDGRLVVWHQDLAGATNRFTILEAGEEPLQRGSWARVTFEWDYRTCPAQRTYFRVALHGRPFFEHAQALTLPDAADGVRGGPWFLGANQPLTPSSLQSFSLYGGGSLDDYLVIAERMAGSAYGFMDRDGNGIGDDWENDRFGFIGIDPSADTDRDGMTHREEFLAGTDPSDPESVLVMTAISMGEGRVNLRWNSRQIGVTPVRRYRVRAFAEPSADIAAWAVLGERILPDGAETEFVDLSAIAAPQRFYRVEIDNSSL